MRYRNLLQEVDNAIKQRLIPNSDKWTICVFEDQIFCFPHERIPLEAKAIQSFTHLQLTVGLSTPEQKHLELLLTKAIKETKK